MPVVSGAKRSLTVGVDLGGFRVCVAEELLDRADRLSGRGEPRTKSVSETVEPDGRHACCPASGLEAFRVLTDIQDGDGGVALDGDEVAGNDRTTERPKWWWVGNGLR
jgi:hypothetical protein